MNNHATRIGIVGAGYWGPNLIRACSQLGSLDSVCDIDDVALESIKRSYPKVSTMSQFDALLARPIEAVIIAAPAQLHASMCLQAIAAGKHVFVEKPLALTVEEGERIAAAAEAAHVSVFVGHLLLYHPGVRKLRALLAEYAIGPVWHLRSRRLGLGKLRSHESVWWSFAPHDIALMLAIMGEEPVNVVAAQTACRNANISDVAYADYGFGSGRTAHLEVCWLDPEKSARLDVFGERGVLTLTDSRDGSTLTHKPFSITQDQRGAPLVVRGEERHISFVEEEPLKLEVKAFIDLVRAGKPVETSARHGIAVLRALAMADEASQKRVERGALA